MCRGVLRESPRLKELEMCLAVVRATYPSLQVRSDNEESTDSGL